MDNPPHLSRHRVFVASLNEVTSTKVCDKNHVLNKYEETSGKDVLKGVGDNKICKANIKFKGRRVRHRHL